MMLSTNYYEEQTILIFGIQFNNEDLKNVNHTSMRAQFINEFGMLTTKWVTQYYIMAIE